MGRAGRVRAAAFLCGAAALLGAPGARAACRLTELAELPVTMAGLRPLTHVRLNGQDAVFVVDTGAFMSVLSPQALQRYGLSLGKGAALHVEGVAGRADAGAAVVDHMDLGGANLARVRFAVVDGIGGDVAGVLGQNILPDADVEYDLAHGLIRYLKPEGCNHGDMLAWWTDRASTQLLLPVTSEISTFGQLNGQDVRLQFDSGTGHSSLTLAAAARLGVTPQSPQVVSAPPGVGIGARSVPTWIAPFDRFDLAAEQVRNTRLRISQADLGADDMVLGADFFLAHRIYVSRLQGKVYFTYNGGPVFRREEPQADKVLVAGVEPAPQDAAATERDVAERELAQAADLRSPPAATLSGVTVAQPKRCLGAAFPADPTIPAPRVVSTYPASGAVVRPGVLVVRITFDLPMTCDGLLARDGNLRFPCHAGPRDMVLSFDRRTIRTVCQTSPGLTYGLQIDPKGAPYPFLSMAGHRAEPYEVTFSASNDRPLDSVHEALAEDQATGGGKAAEVQPGEPRG